MKMKEVLNKRIKPLNPKQKLIKRLKQNEENRIKKLTIEKETQEKKRELNRIKKIKNYG